MRVNLLSVQHCDLQIVQALTIEWGYAATMEETKQWIEDIQSSPNHEMYVASLCGEVCGWVVVEKRIFLGARYKGEITALVVSAKHRRHGVGRELLAKAEGWSRANGLHYLIVRSNVTRTESHDFYSKTGFSFTKTAHNYQKRLS